MILLGGIAAALWVVAITLPIVVLVLIGNLPGDDPARTQRSLTIASGAFLGFALLAIPVTIAVIVVHRAQIAGYET
ncbi:hypothetical protein P9139_15955 [Curtobacterium flaccumfaciens]|nr:hypothetical protein P9139_15955 [Curtobacterium flaccumfaciens]